jgi:hypothetical protein
VSESRPERRPPGGGLGSLGAAELAQRRAMLLARCAVLRERLGGEMATFGRPLSWADQALAAVRWLRAHPLVPAGAAAALALWKPRRAWRWLVRGFGLWRAWRSARGAWSGLLSPGRASSARDPGP